MTSEQRKPAGNCNYFVWSPGYLNNISLTVLGEWVWDIFCYTFVLSKKRHVINAYNIIVIRMKFFYQKTLIMWRGPFVVYFFVEPWITGQWKSNVNLCFTNKSNSKKNLNIHKSCDIFQCWTWIAKNMNAFLRICFDSGVKKAILNTLWRVNPTEIEMSLKK